MKLIKGHLLHFFKPLHLSAGSQFSQHKISAVAVFELCLVTGPAKPVAAAP